ncbi:MAG: hypothetical protein KF781_01205 [Chitinophagaceae bacterium]|nr:hypothetical protein [Chitinophagaceae bacterium]MCW5905353.1 hypothetical protein [Chitinophagaceae bacterium]
MQTATIKKLTPAAALRVKLQKKGVEAHNKHMKKVGSLITTVFENISITEHRKTAWKK